MRLAARACSTGLLLLTASVAFAQYTPPGGPRARPASRQDALEKEMSGTRFHLGPVRIAPWIGLKDVAVVRTVDDTGESGNDLTATVGAGLRGYLRTGPALIWTAEALPEYVWWQDDDARRTLNGRYGAALHGFWNRLDLEIGARRDELQQIVSPEVLTPASVRIDQGTAEAEVRWTGALSTWISVHQSEQTSLAETSDTGPAASAIAELRRLDRREQTARATLRLRRRQSFMVGIGAEQSKAEFASVAGPLDRSNSGISPLVEVRLERPGLFVQAEVLDRSLEAEKGSAFLDYDKVTGSGAATFNPGGRLETSIYGQTGLAYSLLPQYAYLDDERLGAALRLKLGWRTAARVFAEGGSGDYTVLVPGTPERQDDYSAYGGSLQFELGSSGSVTLQATRIEFDSNLQIYDRTYDSIGLSITLAGRD
jgi:hypothetical protein